MLLHEEKYRAALETHRHYDNLSMSVVAGMFGVAFACLSLSKEIDKVIAARPLFIVGAIAVLMLYLIYRRLAHYATVARDVSKLLEKEDGIGISEAYSIRNFTACQNDKEFLCIAFGSIKSLVFAIAMMLSAALLAYGLSP